MEIIALVLLVGGLVVGLLIMYGKLHDANNKAGRVLLLARRLDLQADIIRGNNAYIKELEKAVLDSASPERVADVLNGVFADPESVHSGASLHDNGPTTETQHSLDGNRGRGIPAD